MDHEICDEHKWSYGGNSGIDLCMDCPMGRVGTPDGRWHLYEAQLEPPFGYSTVHIW